MGSGNRRRIQFVECPNNMNGMIDAAKYADVVMLLIDAKYGFEMGLLLVNVGFAIIFPDKCNGVEKKIINHALSIIFIGVGYRSGDMMRFFDYFSV
ncbi:arf-GAP with GTPase, ANK repeat and PH domain-containing protein 9-like [Papaver somniferum]|uniref:arf-GAP with GTPase, ANK repeat and PH domain-containing protein 9-like n=1 Tax=Papaver somniferum TaxID=3469 RepID=UPI000E702EE9|nr:arf-GAP with GTPase, ANK repeat and PH domain-containing protein 9-like [Papaver somniferum]